MISISANKYAIALAQAPGIGSVMYQKILGAYPDLGMVFDNIQEIAKTIGLSTEAERYLTQKNWSEVEAILNWCEEPNHHVITFQDSAYPKQLKQIHGAPKLLYVKGDISVLNDPQLAMVGSRNMSQYGKRNAFDFAKSLVQKGLTITSGMALGIDGESHKGALSVGGQTIAVLGTGLNFIYPKRHLKLAEEIAEQGALISEFPLNMGAFPHNFPKRNRIVSGLSLGALVVEAGLNSGTLITARLAMEQNREVFALPGSVHNPLSRGCHQLIKQGVKLIETVDDILIELKSGLTPYLSENTTHVPKVGESTPSLDPDYKKLWQSVDYEMTPVDLIAERTNFTIEVVSSMLLMLELQNLVKAVPGGYMRISE